MSSPPPRTTARDVVGVVLSALMAGTAYGLPVWLAIVASSATVEPDLVLMDGAPEGFLVGLPDGFYDEMLAEAEADLAEQLAELPEDVAAEVVADVPDTPPELTEPVEAPAPATDGTEAVDPAPVDVSTEPAQPASTPDAAPEAKPATVTPSERVAVLAEASKMSAEEAVAKAAAETAARRAEALKAKAERAAELKRIADAMREDRKQAALEKKVQEAIATAKASIPEHIRRTNPGLAEQLEAKAVEVAQAKALAGRCGPDMPAVRKTGENSYLVRRSLVEHYTSSLKNFNTLGWSKPYRGDDGSKGWEIRGFGCRSPLWKGGLRSKDVLHSINGKKTNTVLQLFFLYQKLKKFTEFEVKIERAGKPITLTYTLD